MVGSRWSCRSRNIRFVQMPGEPGQLARGRRDAAMLAMLEPAMAAKPAFPFVGFCSSCPWRSPAGVPGHGRSAWRERTAAVGPRAGRQHHSAIAGSHSWRQHHRPQRKRRHASPATDGCCPAPARATRWVDAQAPPCVASCRAAACRSRGEPGRSSQPPLAWYMDPAHVDPACPAGALPRLN